MNKNINRTKDPRKRGLWLSSIKRTKRPHRPENKSREAHPKPLKLIIPLMKNLTKTLMKMNLPLSHRRSKGYGRTKVALNGRTPQKACSRKTKIKTKAL